VASGAGSTCFAQAPTLSSMRAKRAHEGRESLGLRMEISFRSHDSCDLVARHPADIALSIAD